MDPVFSEDYTGPRWRYGLQYRPFGFGTVPDGYIIGTLDEDDNARPHRFGTMEYPFPLTEKQLYRYELVLIAGPKGE